MLIRTVLMLAILVWGKSLTAQKSPNCLGMLESYLHCSKQIEIPKGDKQYYIKIKQTIEPSDITEKTFSSIVVLEMADNKWRQTSPEMDCHGEGEEMFVVLKREKLIYVTQNPELEIEKRLQTVSNIQDSLFLKSTVSSCKEVTLGNERWLELQLTPTEAIAKEYYVKLWTITMQPLSGEVSKVRVDYLEGTEYKSITTEYLIVDYNYKGKIVAGRAGIYVKGTNKLRPEYHTYNLINSK